VGKEINEKPSRKHQVITNSIRKGVENYLAENSDVYGFSSTQLVLVSEDLRIAKIVVLFENKDNADRLVDKLNTDKLAISRNVQELISTKYFPSMEFIKGEDENLVF